MAEHERPIQRTVVIGSVLFASILCVLLCVLVFFVFSKWFYERYNAELLHVLTNIENTIDVDDLQHCMETRVPSPKYDELQQRLNTYVDDFDMAYIYVMIPFEDGSILSVCASTSEEERASGDAEDWPLMHYVPDGYTPEQIVPYLAAWDSQKLTYFEDDSQEWGNCYTACLPLVASDGKTLALLCADYFIEDLREALAAYIVGIVMLIVVLTLLFGGALVFWLRRSVTEPIQALERSARSFAERSRGRRDPSALLFEAPAVQAKNELGSLSRALVSMSEDMRDYVDGIVSAEQRAQSAEEEAEGMMRVAYEDALTHVGSKAAYNAACQELEADIAAGKAEFAVLMMDLNNLKVVNDTYGHEHGDVFIVGSCAAMRAALGDVPIYRVGGDEFVALLQGGHYQRRAELFDDLGGRFDESSTDSSREPWERYSASLGMADFESWRDASYNSVFIRADEAMYRSKSQRHAAEKDAERAEREHGE